ncbi:hypothetical protein EVAR_98856_1 [Eumeta japonica]|uniref:Uncharacterized protein n=1 Tax=Eumeta variegata TaxID=151549 RepID=A0A4C1Z409_EUMVA|nr:hypothetical protein EVAR_98856_1 [Eumeta japonica]
MKQELLEYFIRRRSDAARCHQLGGSSGGPSSGGWSSPAVQPRCVHLHHREANKQASHQRENGHRRPWTFSPQRRHQCLAGLLGGKRLSNGGDWVDGGRTEDFSQYCLFII